MAKQFWEGDAPASSEAASSDGKFWEGDQPAAAQALPKGVKPSTEGGGRGSVNPPIPAPALSDEDIAKPAGMLARTIDRGTAPDRRSLLERSVDGGTGIRAALEGQERRTNWEQQQIDARTPVIRAARRQRNDTDEDAGKDFALSGIGSNIVGRAGGKLVAGIAEGIGGTAQAIGDVTGIDTLARAGKATAEGAEAFQKGMGKPDAAEGFGPRSPVPYLQEQAEGAASSLGQSAVLAAGVGAKAVIPVQAILQGGQSYSEARQAGLDPAAALARAIPQGAFEAIGEKFQGLDKAAGAMGTLLNAGAGAAAKRTAADVLVRAGIREIPGEVLTYLGQTGTDLIPGIGLNPNMTMEQFIDGLRDTVIQSGMMGGATAGGGHVARQRIAAEQPSAEQLARSKGFLTGGGTPTPAAPAEAAVAPVSPVPAAISPVQPGAAPAEVTNPTEAPPISPIPAAPAAPPPGAFSRAAAAVGVLEDDGIATAARDPNAKPKTFAEQRDMQREVARQEEESDAQADFEAAMLSDQLAPTTTKATDEAPKETKAPAAPPAEAPAPAPAPAARSKAVVVDVPAPAPAIAGESGRATGKRDAADPDAAPAGKSDTAARPGAEGSPSAAVVSSEGAGRNPAARSETSPAGDVVGDRPAPAARPGKTAAAPAAASKSAPARPADLAPRAPARASGSTEEGRATYKSIEEATAFVSAQRARGTSISAVPFVNEDGEILVATKGTPEYERGLDQRQERIVKKARDEAGILDDDVVHANGLAFKNAVAARTAAKKAGPGFAPVAVKGGFVARKSAEGTPDVSSTGNVRGVAAEAARGEGDNASGSVPAGLRVSGASRPAAVPAAPVAAGEQGGLLPPTDRPDAALTPLAAAAHEAATSPTNDTPEPTQAQIEAGNYRKGHIKVQGLDISVENPQGSTRSGTGPGGVKWSHTMSDHYGYIKRTEGADGEQVDVYVGPKPDSNRVFVVDQLNQADDSFDEHKVMLGYPSQPLAMRAYKSNFDKGWKVGKVTAMTVDEFKAWLKEGDTAAPAAPATPEIAKLRNSAISAQSSTPTSPKPGPSTAEPGPKQPKVKRELKADRLAREADEARAAFYKPGNVVRSYGGQFDKVVSYQPAADGRWSVTVQHVKKTGPATFEDIPGEPTRTHSTQPDERALRTGPSARMSVPVAAAPTPPKANGESFGELYHGTPLAFDKFDPERMRGMGSGEDHQGLAVYLTNDRTGYARFFARNGVGKRARKDKTMTEAQRDALWDSDGTVLNVTLDPKAKILDMRADTVDPQVKTLFVQANRDRAAGDLLRKRVLDLGYDGIAFAEPVGVDGWETAKDAATVALYRADAARITGNEPPAKDFIPDDRAKREAAAQRAGTADAETKRAAAGNRARARAWEDNPGRAFIAKHGIALELAGEWAPGAAERRAAMVQGFGPIFRKSGMQLDTLTEAAVEEGFLKEPDEAQMHALIDKAIRKQRVAPLYAEGVAETEMEARIARERQFEQDAFDAVNDPLLSDEFIDQISDDAIPWDSAADGTTESFLRELGATDEEVRAEVERLAASEERRAAGDPGLVEGEPLDAQAPDSPARGRQERRGEPAGGETAGLTSPSVQEVVAQQQRAAQGERAEASTRRERTARLDAGAQVGDFTLTGSDRASDSNPDQDTMFSVTDARDGMQRIERDAAEAGVELRLDADGGLDEGSTVDIQWLARTKKMDKSKPAAKGAGAKVMQQLVDWADAHGLELRLGITDNRGAKKLQAYYEGFDFERTDPYDNYDRIMRREPADSGASFSVADQTDSPAFKKWFGDSKVVDSAGAPLVVYHGTASTEISEFLPRDTNNGANTTRSMRVAEKFRKLKAENGRLGYMEFRSGSFFSPHPEYAGNYTGEDGGVMYPVYIKAENPVYMDGKSGVVTGTDPTKTPDALILRDDGVINEIVVLDPAQVKSAIGNRGTFDSANDDIRFSAADQTETAAFENWFGDSKVVDSSGKPRVLYHGTPAADLRVFDANKIGANGRSEGAGFYFTTDKSIADGYGHKGETLKVYANIQKPLAYNAKPFNQAQMQKLLAEVAKAEVKDTGSDWRDGFLSNFGDTYSKPMDAVVREAARSFAGEETALDQVSGLIGAGVDAATVNTGLTNALGYDGYFSKGYSGEGNKGGDIWVAMRSEQIKSATDNSGTFDATNPDIRMRTGEGAGTPVKTKPASSEHDRKAARLLDNLRASQDGYIGFQAVEPDESGPDGRVFAALRTIAKRMFGHDVVFVRFNGPAVFNGAMSSAVPDTVFVRIDSSQPHMAILGHELLHALRGKNPTLYSAIEHRLNQLTNEKTGAYFDDLKQKYDAIGRAAPKGSKLREELYADIVGDNFLSPEFWQDMAADQPGLFRRVADAILRFLDKVILSLANSSPLGTKDLLRDAQEARRVVTAGMRAFSQQARARTGLATSTGESLSAAGSDGVKALVSRLESEHPGLKLDMAGSGNTLTLSRIVAPARGTGIGTKVMKAITDFADAEGKRIVLTPSGDFGGNRARLVEFYKRHGFIENKGRARDFTTKETMLREPVAAPAVEPAPPTGTLAFQRWFGKSKIVDESGKPRVAYRAMTGTTMQQNESIGMMHVALDRRMAEEFARDGRQVQEVYVSANNPFDYRDKSSRAWIVKEMTKPENVALFNQQTNEMMGEGYDHEADAREIQGGLEAGAFQTYEVPMVAKMIRARGHDAIYMHEESDPRLNLAVFEPGQVKSATGNRGAFDASSPDIRLSAEAPAPAPAAPKKANPALTKAIFGGSMQFTRDQSGKPVRLEEQKKLYEKINTDERGQMLLRLGHVTPDQLKRWKESPLDVYDGAVNNRFRKHFESPGIVWKDSELRDIFKLDDEGIAAYRALRAEADQSIARHAVADMLRLAGADGLAVREQMLAEPMDVAALTLRDHLLALADQSRTPAPAPKVTMTEKERTDALERAVQLEAEANVLAEKSPDKPPATALAKRDEAKKLRADVSASIQAPASMTVEARRLTDRANMVIDILDQANDDMGGGKVPDDMKAQARPNPWESTEPGRLDRVIYEMQDGKIDLKRTQEAIEKSGAKIREEFDARLAETLYSGRMAKRTQTFLEKEGRPLLQQMAMNGVGQVEFGDYLHARAAPERNDQIAKINPDMPDGGAGANSKGLLLTNAAARKYIADIPAERRAKLEAMAQRVDAITKGTRALLVAEGLEKADTIAAWEAVYKTYVPMFREDVEFSRITTSRRAMGSEKRAVNILANVLLQREAAITRAEKNRVKVALYGLALTSPNPDFWVTIRPESDRAEIAEDLKRMGIDATTAEAGMANPPTVSKVDPVTGLVTEELDQFYRDQPTAINLKINGEHRVLVLNKDDPRALRMALSMKGADNLTQLDIAGSIIGRATRWLAAVNTQYNPVFGLVNFMRDTMGGVIHLGNTELRGSSAKVLGNLPGALAGITAHLAGRQDKGKWSKLFEQFQEDGGQTGFREMFADGTKRAEKVEKDLSVMSRHALDPRRAVNGLLDLLGGFNEVTENAVRLSAYAEALDKGISRPEAARLARELTVDFNRKGRATREIGPLYAFFNAAIQGNERTLRALRGPTGAKIIAGGLALGVMQALMMAAAGYDDDEIPDYIKARALIIPLFNKEKSYIAIPLPLGLHVIPNTGRVLTEMVIGDRKKLAKKTTDSVGEILAAFNPLGGGNVFTMDGALRTIMPTVIDPLIELGFNKNFAGNQIEREARGQYDSRPGAERARASTQKTFTGQTYIGISKALNRLTGGDDFQPGAISPTPERVRYLTQTLLGGVARETERIIDASVAKSKGQELPWSRTPIASRFYGQVENDRVQQSRYYENIKSLEQTEGQIKAAKKSGDGVRMEEIAAANPNAAFIGASNKVQQQVQKLNKLSVQVIGNKEEQDAIDKKKIEAMQALNDGIREMERSRRKPSIAENLRRVPATQAE